MTREAPMIRAALRASGPVRMTGLTLSIVLGSACASAPGQPRQSVANTDQATRWDAAPFDAMKPRYMQALDDQVHDPTAAALAMEAELERQVERASRARDAGELRSAADRESAGLALIYGALFLERDVGLVERGKLDGSRLYAAHRYGASMELAAEGLARRTEAVRLLEAARQLRPNDGRIASWLAGAIAQRDRSPAGPLTEKDQALLVSAVDAEPTFNLWTAFIAMRDEPIDSPQAQQLFDKTRAFLASRKCRDVAPNDPEARNCVSGPLAPFNSQASIVMLADQYMQRGESALRRGELREAMPLLGTARGILATLSSPKLQPTTRIWRNAPQLETRLQRLNALRPGGPVPDPGFWRSESYEAVYSCASCHTH